MPAPLSMDLRERIVRSVEGGSSIREAARRFEVSASVAIKLMRRVRETGSATPAQVGGHRPAALAGHEQDLLEVIEARPDITLAGRAAAPPRPEPGALDPASHAPRPGPQA